jgi:hypothetical protein
MFGFSILMLGSMHAVQWNHPRHHRHCLTHDDMEAMGTHRSAPGAILLDPRFPSRLHQAALAGASRAQRAWIIAELAAGGIWLATPRPGMWRIFIRWSAPLDRGPIHAVFRPMPHSASRAT